MDLSDSANDLVALTVFDAPAGGSAAPPALASLDGRIGPSRNRNATRGGGPVLPPASLVCQLCGESTGRTGLGGKRKKPPIGRGYGLQDSKAGLDVVKAVNEVLGGLHDLQLPIVEQLN